MSAAWPKESAIEALRARAFREEDEVEYVPAGVAGEDLYRRDVIRHGRNLVHCYAGSFGADWDLDDAIREVEGADRVEFRHTLVGHNLVTVTGERVRCFDVGEARP